MQLQFGAELELADWDRSIEIPRQLGVKDVNDITVMNSDGTCVYPYNFEGKGGEICTRVCDSPLELATVCDTIISCLDTYSLNHSCWLHIHVGLPTAAYDTLDKLKDILRYTYTNSIQIRDYTSICPVKEGGKMKPEHRIRRNLTRTSVMYEREYLGAMKAQTTEEFWKYFERKRHMVNMLPLKYQGTIEFRCFYMTDQLQEFKGAARFAEAFVEDMLSKDQVNVVGILYENDYLFPKAIAFNPELEEIYIETLSEKRPKLDNFTLKPWGSGN